MFGLRQTNDADVVRSVLRGDRERYAVLVREYLPSLHAVAYAHLGNHADAEDIAQETLLRAYKALDRLNEAALFGPWVIAIARNLARTLLVRKRRHRELLEAMPRPTPTEPDIAERDLRNLLRHEIGKLDAGQREVLLLHYFSGLPAPEIGSLLNISEAAAAKRIQRAREALGLRMVEALSQEKSEEKTVAPRASQVMAAIAALPAPPWSKALPHAVAHARVLPAGVWTGALAGTLALVALVAGLRTFVHANSKEFAAAAAPIAAVVEQTIPPSEPPPPPPKYTVPVVDAPKTHLPEPSLPPVDIVPAGYPGKGNGGAVLDTVAGTVYRADGSLAPGAAVWVARFGAGAIDTRESRTDDGGCYAFELPPGVWKVYAARGPEGGWSGSNLIDSVSTLGVGQSIRADVRMAKGCVVAAQLVDAVTGAPVANGKIFTSTHRVIAADSEGCLMVEGLWQGEHTLMAMAPGREDTYVLLNTAAREESRLVIRMKEGGTLRGVVRDVSGRPVSHAWVSGARTGSYCTSALYRVCDEQGRFELAGLPLDRPIHLLAQVPCYINSCEGPLDRGKTEVIKKMTLTTGAAAPQTEFTLTATRLSETASSASPVSVKPKAGFRGRVVDSAGMPVRDFSILVQVPSDLETFSNNTQQGMEIHYEMQGVLFNTDDGVFTIGTPDLVPGNVFRLVAVAEGGEAVIEHAIAQEFKALLSTVPLTLKLSPPKTLRLTVKDETGRPIEGADIHVVEEKLQLRNMLEWRDIDGPLARRSKTVLTDAAGMAVLDSLGILEGALIVRKAGYSNYFEPFNAALLDRKIRMSPACGFAGAVLDESGQPVDEGTVSLRLCGDRIKRSAERDIRFEYLLEKRDRGAFSFENLPAGDYQVSVSVPDDPGISNFDSRRLAEDQFVLEPGKRITRTYPRDSAANNVDTWQEQGVTEADRALQAQVVGTWILDVILETGEGIRHVLTIQPDGTLGVDTIWADGQTTTSEQGTRYKIAGGRLCRVRMEDNSGMLEQTVRVDNANTLVLTVHDDEVYHRVAGLAEARTTPWASLAPAMDMRKSGRAPDPSGGVIVSGR